MTTMTFTEFQQQSLAEGFDEALERVWSAGAHVPDHGHPFQVKALVVQGEMWLTVNGKTRHLTPGDPFELARDEPHAERYGPNGAVYWVARKAGSPPRHKVPHPAAA